MTFLYSRMGDIDSISELFKSNELLFLNCMKGLYKNLEFIIIDANDEREELESNVDILIDTKMFFRKLFKIGNCFHIMILDTNDDCRMIYEKIFVSVTYKELFKEIQKLSRKYSPKTLKDLREKFWTSNM